MIDLMIERGKGEKTRMFPGRCAAFVTAYHLFEKGSSRIRPAWAMFAGSEQEARPFVANLRLGYEAHRTGAGREVPEERFEFLKSNRYAVEWQREPEGALATVYYPELFKLDPGFVDPEEVGFVCLVPEDWAAAQRVDPYGPAQHAIRLAGPNQRRWGEAFTLEDFHRAVPAACLFAAYLDARTRCPMILDPRFSLQVLLAALDAGLASLPRKWSRSNYYKEWGRSHDGFMSDGLTDVGFRNAFTFKADHATVERFLAEQVAVWFKAVK